MTDLLKVVAFIKVYHTPVYAKMYFNLDHGKDNLHSYFIPRGWTKRRISIAVKKLKENFVISKEKADNTNLYSLSLLHKTYLNLLD